MNIGFDLDGIFIDKLRFMPKFIVEGLYRKQNTNELTYRYPSKVEQTIRKISHKSIFRPAFEENIVFLNKLAKNNSHKRYLISGRFGFLKKETEDILKKYEITQYLDKQFLNFGNQQPHIFKDVAIKKMKIDLYVDDDLPLLEFLTDKNLKVKFFWLNNKQTKPLKNNLFAINHISEMFK